MKVFVEGKIYDADETPIYLIMENDKERFVIIHNLSHMPNAKGRRIYVTFPDSMPTSEIKKQVDKIQQSNV